MSGFAEWISALRASARLTPAANAVLDTVERAPNEASYRSAQAIADASDVNVATVVRAAQTLGFSGWPAFSTEVRARYLASLSSKNLYLHNRSEGQMQAMITQDISLLERMRGETEENALNRMAECIVSARGTGVFATGSYAAPGLQLSHVSQMLGYPVRLHSGSVTSMVNEVSLLSEADCFLAITLWKSSKAVVQLAEAAKRQGAGVLVISDRHTSLTEMADEYALVPAESSDLISSLVCVTSAVQYLLGCLARHDEERTQSRLGNIDELWRITSAVVGE